MTNSELPAENAAKHAEFDPEPAAELAADEAHSSPFLPLIGCVLFLAVGLWWGLTGPESASPPEAVKAVAAPSPSAASPAAPAKPVAARPPKPTRPRPPAGAAGVAAGRGTAPDIERLRNQIRQLNAKKAGKAQ